jgi:cobalt-zinc-cadmium efflux system membrane fusion protein
MKVTRIVKISALCVCVAILSGCSRHKADDTDAPPAAKIEQDKITFATNAPQLAYLTIEPVRERKTVANALSGRLAWDDDITARVFPPVSGRIAEILANPGQPVSAGDVLAKIKSPDFGQAQAEARKALADLTVAEHALNRTRDLLEHGAAAQKDLESAEADHTRALSEKERALATLALYGGDGTADVNGVFSLKAPVGGVVVEKSINPGQEVRSDQIGDKPLFVISEPNRLWLFLDVTETDAASLSSNQEVIVRARALPAKIFHGRVEVIGQGLDATTRTIKARCVVDNSEKVLRAEMYVSADVTSAASGVDVPTKAVFSKDTEHYVFVETASGQFQRRPVKLGLESNGRSVLGDGLSPGEKVVTDGCLLLEVILEGENP